MEVYLATALYDTTAIAILIHTRHVTGRLLKPSEDNLFKYHIHKSATEPRDLTL